MDTSLKIPCTLIPTNGHNLLLPNSGIAEVIICNKLASFTTTSKIPHWVIGVLHWQEQNVYIIDFNGIDNHDSIINRKENAKRTIVIIRNSSKENSTNKVAFFGIIINGTAKVIEVNSLNIDKNRYPETSHSHAISYVDINHIEAIIPNIPALTGLIEELNLP